jgi:integrase
MAHIQKRRGRWQARVRGPDGRERTRTFRTKDEAQRWLHGKEAEKQRGEWVDPRAGKTRLDEWADQWLAAARPTLKESTATLYAGLLKSRILPTFGRYKLAAIRPLDVQQWIGSMGGAGLSPSRIRQAHVILARILDSAVQNGILARNAARGVKLPRLERREADYLEPATVDRIVAAMPTEHGYDTLVRLLGVGGLRFGEAAALRRRSIDLLRKRVHVNESVAEVAGRLHRSAPKTHATRSVAVSASLAKSLETHLNARVAADPDAPVFTGPEGGPLRLSAFYHRVWRPTLASLGLPAVRLHSLRHSAAARLIAAGASPKAIQSVMGHGSAAFSLTVYGHLFESDLDELVERLDGVARTSRGLTVVPIAEPDKRNTT